MAIEKVILLVLAFVVVGLLTVYSGDIYDELVGSTQATQQKIKTLDSKTGPGSGQ